MLKSTGARFLIVGVLALFMVIPLMMVSSVIDARAHYSREAIRTVGDEWGGRQSIYGPILVLPVQGPVTIKESREAVDPVTGAVTVEMFEVTKIQAKRPVFVLPMLFDADLGTQTEQRKRGIFQVPVYTADLSIAFDYDTAGVDAQLQAGEEILWSDAYLQVGLTANKALRGVASLTVDGADFPLEPRGADGTGESGIRADLGDPRLHQTYQLALGFNGAESVMVSPVGRTSNVTMQSDWPHPSFSGAYLPNEHEVTEAGFEATWSIPHLARNLPQVSRSDTGGMEEAVAFGVRFYQPNDFYQKAFRAANYGILFVSLTFLTVLLIEMRQKKQAHPVQYILIGLAQAIFVLLMVAYAEQIGFAYAYLLASVATVGLLIVYGVTGLKLGRRVWVLAAMLVVLYGLLYMILRSADYALLAGATLSFAALAGTMIATRNEEWSAPEGTPRLFTRKKKLSVEEKTE
ncbi:cell envelope integrity protein CreD [Yoonia sp. MH D7]